MFQWQFFASLTFYLRCIKLATLSCFFRTGQIGVLEDTRTRTLHGILLVQSCYRGHQVRRYLKNLRRGIAALQSFIRGVKTRKDYAILLQRHRAAITIQKQIKSRICCKKFRNLKKASVLVQSVIRGWLVRRCSGDIGLLQSGERKGKEPEEVLVNLSFLAELHRRVLKAEAALREKEEAWQKQMRSLQSSLSIARKSLALDDSQRNSDVSLNGNDDRESTWETGSNIGIHEKTGERSSNAGLNVIGRLADEFEQRSQVFGDDAKFLVEVKSGQVEAGMDPDLELHRLKHMFEAWKKDYGSRLRETKVILHKLGHEEGSGEKAKKKWWGGRNSTRVS